MKKKGILVRLFFIAGAAVCLFAACKVGLGESVDTRAPDVSIEYPSANSYIKGDVKFGGVAKDDEKLASVTLNFHRADTTSSDEDIKYVMNASQLNGRTWEYTVKTGDGVDEDGKSKVPDGVYEVTVTAMDAAGRTSIIKRSVTIDNKAPTVLVTTPSTYGGVNSSSQFQQIDIKGSIYDATALTEVKIYIYDENGECKASKDAD